MKKPPLAAFALILSALLPSLPNVSASETKQATIYRDEFGIPHVFAPTLEAAAYAIGYAQAEDRLEELLTNYRRSNEILISPKRTAMKAPIAIIDPHLSWYGEFRFYQARIYAGDFNISGVSIVGSPIPSLGHSRYCSIAMTTGGPDTSDVFEEEVNPANPHQYKYDGQWREMTVRKERIGVKAGDKIEWREVEFTYSHHGPILGHKVGKAYAAAIPYMNEIGLTDQIYQMFTAHNLNEMKRAISQFQLMYQNIMVATIQGDIFYVRNGRVPIRAKGVDPSKPIAGNISCTEWKGIHPFKDLVQITNPPSGYMHNCNVTPFGMMKDSPLTPEKYAKYPYIYNATRTAPLHQRAQMMTEVLDRAVKVDHEKAIEN